MPIYTYKCAECGNTYDKLQRLSDQPPQCATCGAESGKQEKQLSTGTGFCLMGYGWSRPGMSASKGSNK